MSLEQCFHSSNYHDCQVSGLNSLKQFMFLSWVTQTPDGSAYCSLTPASIKQAVFLAVLPSKASGHEIMRTNVDSSAVASKDNFKVIFEMKKGPCRFSKSFLIYESQHVRIECEQPLLIHDFSHSVVTENVTDHSETRDATSVGLLEVFIYPCQTIQYTFRYKVYKMIQRQNR